MIPSGRLKQVAGKREFLPGATSSSGATKLTELDNNIRLSETFGIRRSHEPHEAPLIWLSPGQPPALAYPVARPITTSGAPPVTAHDHPGGPRRGVEVREFDGERRRADAARQ
jgi:hypothetical protein